MVLNKSQFITVLAIVILGVTISGYFFKNEAFARGEVDTRPSTTGTSTGDASSGLTPEQIKQRDLENKFNAATRRFADEDARLGNELSQLPGPQINFEGLMRVVITWSASLAASVAIFLFVLRSFAAISGTEESHNQLKTTIIKILIGLILIFFSYQLVSFIMGIVWAGTS